MKKHRKAWLEFLMILLGVVMMACAINIFYSPNQMVTGGVTGIGIIVNGLSQRFFSMGIPIWLTNIILNIPIFIVAVCVLGKKILGRTLFATVALTGALFFTEFLPTAQGDYILSAVFGGALTGFGLGIVIRNFATTGGTDLLSSVIHRYLKHISVSNILFVVDALIIVCGFFLFDKTTAMYAIIAVYITSKTITSVLEGLSFAKAAMIISDQGKEIADTIMAEMERGATAFMAKGMYTGDERAALLCVLSPKEIVTLKELVGDIDKNAFVIVADVREVLGLGFQSF